MSQPTGAVVEWVTYDVYGLPTIRDKGGTVVAQSAVGNPYLFTGREYDPESGKYFYRARSYDPASGRFLQRDPLGYVDGLSLHEYASSTPAVRTDPTGTRDKKTPNKKLHSAYAKAAAATQAAMDSAGKRADQVKRQADKVRDAAAEFRRAEKEAKEEAKTAAEDEADWQKAYEEAGEAAGDAADKGNQQDEDGARANQALFHKQAMDSEDDYEAALEEAAFAGSAAEVMEAWLKELEEEYAALRWVEYYLWYYWVSFDYGAWKCEPEPKTPGLGGGSYTPPIPPDPPVVPPPTVLPPPAPNFPPGALPPGMSGPAR